MVDVVYANGDTEKVLAGYIHWDRDAPAYFKIKSWKPNMDALIELQEKPVEREVIGYLFMSKTGLPSSYLSVSDIESSMYTVDELKSRGPGPCRPVYKKRDTHHSK